MASGTDQFTARQATAYSNTAAIKLKENVPSEVIVNCTKVRDVNIYLCDMCIYMCVGAWLGVGAGAE